jgi:hypothetical protein
MPSFFFFARVLLRAAVALLKLKQKPQKLKCRVFFFVNAGALAGSSGCAEADAAADTEMPDAGGFVQLAQVQRHTDVGKGQENRGTYSVRPHTLVAEGLIH